MELLFLKKSIQYSSNNLLSLQLPSNVCKFCCFSDKFICILNSLPGSRVHILYLGFLVTVMSESNREGE